MSASSTSALSTGSTSLAGQRVLLTGATGLVGRRVLGGLLAAGARAVALVRTDPRTASPTNVELDALLDGAERIAVPSWTPTQVRAALLGRVVDLVVHLGAYGVSPAQRDALAMVDGNVGVTVALLDALAPTPPRRFLFAGSSAQYRPVATPTRLGEDAVQAPTSLYGACKRAAEEVGATLAGLRSIPFVCLRLFGVYGPGEAAHRLVPYLARALAAGRTPELTAGDQVRDWVYVDDVAEAILTALSAPLEHGAYNVCCGDGTSVREVAREVGRVLGTGTGAGDRALGLGKRPYRPDEPMWLVGDPSRLRAATGWHPRTPLADGLRRTVEWALASASSVAP